jgi:WD40 repeat protein
MKRFLVFVLWFFASVQAASFDNLKLLGHLEFQNTLKTQAIFIKEDGTAAVTKHEDGTLKYWSINQLTPVWTLQSQDRTDEPDSGEIIRVHFLTDRIVLEWRSLETLEISLAGKPMKRLLNPKLLKIRAILKALDDPRWVLHPNQKLLVVTSNRQLKVIDLETSKQIATLNEVFDFNTQPIFSPDGRWLAFSQENRQVISLWDTTTWQKRANLRAYAGISSELYFQDDSSSLIILTDANKFLLWSLPNLALKSQSISRNCNTNGIVAVAPNASAACALFQYGPLQWFNSESNDAIQQSGHTLRRATFDPSGSRFMTINSLNQISIYDSNQIETPTQNFDGGQDLQDGSFIDNKNIILTYPSKLVFYNLERQKVTREEPFEVENNVSTIRAFNNRIGFLYEDTLMKLLRYPRLEDQAVHLCGPDENLPQVNPQLDILFCFGYKTLEVRDLQSGKKLWMRPWLKDQTKVYFQETGSLIAFTLDNGKLQVMDARTGKVKAITSFPLKLQPKNENDFIWADHLLNIVISPSGRTILASLDDGSLHAVDLANGRELKLPSTMQRLPGQGIPQVNLKTSFSSNGQYLILSDQSHLELWGQENRNAIGW